jgi:hypothetical protein
LVEARGLSFLWVKIQLYSYALHDGVLPPSARAEFILRGFETSYHFLEVFSSTLAVSPFCSLPALHSFAAVCSWMFVLKALYSRFQMYLDISATEEKLVEIQKMMTSNSEAGDDFCGTAGKYMETLLANAKVNERNLGEPYLAVRSRMAAGLYYDGVLRYTDLMNPRDLTAKSLCETKPILTSPQPAPLCSLSSSPFLSSDGLETPPCHLPQLESLCEKPMFEGFWNETETVDTTFMSESSKVHTEWFADSYVTDDGNMTRGDLSKYVSPGLLMVQ